MTKPKLFPVPFANGGDKNEISNDRLSGDSPQKVNFTDGFPAVTEQPKSAGGKAPLRKDFNGVLYHLTDNVKHTQSGASYHFDMLFAAAIGGYPKGAILLSNDDTARYVSLINDNTSDFNVSADPTKWAKTSLTDKEVRASHGIARFTASGVFTVPDGVGYVFVSGCAGGGAGGGGAGSSGQTTGVGGGGGGGGGAGQAAIKARINVTAGEEIAIGVGVGGIAGVGANSQGISSGTGGGDGGATTIGSHISLAGGKGGKLGGWSTADALPQGGGAGGLGGSGYPDGADGLDGNYMGAGGTGGASPFGGGGASGRAGAGNGGVGAFNGGFAGTGGGNYGSGGGGGGGSYGTFSGNGGNGGSGRAGIVIIEW